MQGRVQRDREHLVSRGDGHVVVDVRHNRDGRVRAGMILEPRGDLLLGAGSHQDQGGIHGGRPRGPKLRHRVQRRRAHGGAEDRLRPERRVLRQVTRHVHGAARPVRAHDHAVPERRVAPEPGAGGRRGRRHRARGEHAGQAGLHQG